MSPAAARSHQQPASQTNADFAPDNDIAGDWICDGDETHPAHEFRDGRNVRAVYDNSGYHHVFSGRYVNTTTIKGIQTRVNLSNHSTTRMALTLIFDTPDTFHANWVALDSHSDLQKGQTGVAHIVRLAPPPAPARKDMD